MTKEKLGKRTPIERFFERASLFFHEILALRSPKRVLARFWEAL